MSPLEHSFEEKDGELIYRHKPKSQMPKSEEPEPEDPWKDQRCTNCKKVKPASEMRAKIPGLCIRCPEPRKPPNKLIIRDSEGNIIE